jgi:hypothetical protein
MIEEAKAVAQRLRKTSFSNDWRTFIKAADAIDALVQEVERLQKTNAVLRADIATPASDIVEAVLEKHGHYQLCAEVERLKQEHK